jgi:ribose transport system permease protein
VWAGVAIGWWHLPPELGLFIGVGIGALAGLVNGLIVTRLGINALIATLATMTIYRGLTYLTAGTGVTPIGDTFKAYGQSVFLGIQTPFWVMLAVVLVGGWSVAKTRFFRQYYFIGGNARAAKLSGIRVERLTLIGFIIVGVLAGLAGVLGASRLNSAVVSAGIGVELSVITATVLGGASLKGGEGTILGGVLGVLFIALVHQRHRHLLAAHHRGPCVAACRFARPLQAGPPWLTTHNQQVTGQSRSRLKQGGSS